MFKTLSKSTIIMFIYDFLVLCSSTLILSNLFGYTTKAIIFLCFLVVFIGLIVLFLKGNYRIREFNITSKNSYLLFEGIVITHILPAAYLIIFALSTVNAIKFVMLNILIIFIFLRLYRNIYHYYLFKVINGQAKLKISDTKLKFFNFVLC